MSGVANAVAAGIGIAPLPVIYFEDPVFKDVLVPVLPENPQWQATLYIVYVSRKYVPLKMRTFIDFLVEYTGKFQKDWTPAARQWLPRSTLQPEPKVESLVRRPPEPVAASS
jgi:hypothetical protein